MQIPQPPAPQRCTDDHIWDCSHENTPPPPPPPPPVLHRWSYVGLCSHEKIWIQMSAWIDDFLHYLLDHALTSSMICQSTVEIKTWMSNWIPLVCVYVITYPDHELLVVWVLSKLTHVSWEQTTLRCIKFHVHSAIEVFQPSWRSKGKINHNSDEGIHLCNVITSTLCAFN